VNLLLDTKVVSEWTKPQPNPHVVTWLAEVDEDRAFLSVATLAEIRRGVERLQKGRRRDRLARWLSDDLPVRFEDRILPIDRGVAEAGGVVVARGEKAGTTVGTMDAFFAATAEVYGLTLATRNVKDFGRLGIRLFDPWNPQS
jgi:predicted nucleic acid-binding protein